MKWRDSLQTHLAIRKEKLPFAQTIDYKIQKQGGTTSVLSSLPVRTQRNQSHHPVHDRIIELNGEIGQLENEDAYFKTLANEILIDFLTLLRDYMHSVHSSVRGCKRIVDLHSATLGDRHVSVEGTPTSPDWSNERVHAAEEPESYALKSSLKHSALVKSLSQMSHQLPDSHSTNCNDMLENLVVHLTRENGRMRQSIALNRELVCRVLLPSIARVRHRARSIKSLIKQRDDIVKRTNEQWQPEIVLSRTENPCYSSWHLEISPHLFQQPEKQDEYSPFVAPLTLSTVQYSDFEEGDSTPSAAKFEETIRNLQRECTYYKRLVNEGLLQLLPMMEYHSDKLYSTAHKFSVEDHKLRHSGGKLD